MLSDPYQFGTMQAKHFFCRACGACEELPRAPVHAASPIVARCPSPAAGTHCFSVPRHSAGELSREERYLDVNALTLNPRTIEAMKVPARGPAAARIAAP